MSCNEVIFLVTNEINLFPKPNFYGEWFWKNTKFIENAKLDLQSVELEQ